MLRRKASGFVAAMLATAAITGSVFATDLGAGSAVQAPTESPAVEAVAETAQTEAPAEAPAAEAPATEVTETEALAAEVSAQEVTEAVDGEAVDDAAVEEDAEVPAEEAAADDEIIAEEVPADAEVPAATVAPAEAVTEAVPAVEEQAAPAEAATLTIKHHFVSGDIECVDYEVVDGLTAGGSAVAADYSYTDTYEFAECINADASVELAAGENQLTIEYTLAAGYMIVE